MAHYQIYHITASIITCSFQHNQDGSMSINILTEHQRMTNVLQTYFFSLRHFSHLSYNGIKTCRNSIH